MTLRSENFPLWRMAFAAVLLGASVLGLLGAPAGTALAEAPPPPAGQPLVGLSADELARFERGRTAFERPRSIATGLGPLFNDVACNRCHNRRGVGGAGIQSATQIGRQQGDTFDALVGSGGPSLSANTIVVEPAPDVQRLIPGCRLPRDSEPLPAAANVIVRRRTTPLFGLGLVDATPDATFEALARRQPESIRGRVARVQNRATRGVSVGKFGWKSQAPTLHQFSGLALLMELGVTSPEYATEDAPAGDSAAVGACDALPDPEDDGADVERMTDFMRLLAPVAPLASDAREVRAGDALFSRAGCDSCHVRALRSGPSPIAALSEQTYAPYSDFLLHDMGALGDGIVEGDAGPREMRTAPLWGTRLGLNRFLHDGRARSLSDAILAHDGQGAAARAAFTRLDESQRRALVAFLETL
jgi:CxxC motif-containing protein (DUF1111 family)